SHIRVKPAIRTLNTNGYEVTDNAFVGPWLLRIMDGDQFACGASYYKPLYALTSASCLYKYKGKLDSLSVEFLSGSEFSLIDTVYVHRLYQWHSNFMDIAVVKLLHPLAGNNNEFVKLCQHSTMSYKMLTVVGCGPTNGRVATQQITRLSQVDCARQYGSMPLAETIACAHAFNRLANDCVYDFGCPVTAGDELCGVVAYGPACNYTRLPGLFTDIHQVKHFIERVV
ncbi:hypothetical protein KR222_008813, partial [Zaprionus bogoriensis]